ncbi:hypothetical protein KSC_048040 [Ktedonobacter sp. SOSP1-52]|nr:hypothetical protein KSC_048040 [Ktedonobacter sp. SOSP1-52]
MTSQLLQVISQSIYNQIKDIGYSSRDEKGPVIDARDEPAIRGTVVTSAAKGEKGTVNTREELVFFQPFC